MLPLISFSVRHPKWVVAIAILITLSFAVFIPALQKDPRIIALVSETEPSVLLRDKMEQIFGNSNLVLIQVTEDDIFAPNTLQHVTDVINDLESKAEIKDVHSIFSTKFLTGDDGSFKVGDLVASNDMQLIDIPVLKQRLQDDPLYKGNIVSFDYNSLGLLIEFEHDISDERMVDAVTAVLNSHQVDTRWPVGGLPIIHSEINHNMDRDMGVLFPGFLFLVALMFFAAFRSLRGLLLPFVPVLLSLVVTMGTMVMLDLPLTIVSNMIPMLLIAIGSAYSIHFLNQYYKERQSGNHPPATLALQTGRHVSGITAVAGITTVIGFASNVFNPVIAIRDFGLMLALGVVVAVIACITLLPALITLLKPEPLPATSEEVKTDGFNRLLDKLISHIASLVITRPLAFVLSALVVVAISAVGIMRVEVESSGLSFFKDDARVVADAREISKGFGGVVGLDFVIQTEEPDGVKTLAVMQTLDAFSQWIKAEYPDDVKITISLADYIKQMSKAYNGGEEYYRIPDSQEELLQYFEIYEWSGDIEEDFRNISSDDFSMARITGRFALKEFADGSFREEPVQYNKQILDEAQAWLNQHLPDGVSAQPFGEMMIVSVINDSIISGQILSLLLALIMVLIVTAILFKSLVGGLISLIPVLFAIITNFGIMGFFDIPLNIATALVSAMAIGIGVDDTIHFLMTFKKFSTSHTDYRACVSKTLQYAGRAIIYTTIALVAGYGVMLFSGFTPVIYFGVLNMVTIIMATYGSLFVLSAVILLIKPRFLLSESEPSSGAMDLAQIDTSNN